ncbi:MAG: TRAP transporter substrate-binding protein DctP [Pseudomonadota bacterium]|nr:TRAP transporter substrate-binding protein DctP [Pseudomonadota bacterium]
MPAQHHLCAKVLPEMGRRISEATEGRVTISIPPKSLAGAGSQYEGVTQQVMDGAISFNGFLTNVASGLEYSILPFQGREDAAAASAAQWDTYQKFFAGTAADMKGVVVLALYAQSGADMWSMLDTPINSLDDLRSRKIWALPGATANLMQATGSAVVSGPATQMLEIISNRVVDGYVGVAWNSLNTYKLTSYTKSATILDRKIFQSAFTFFVGEDKWARISPEDQQAIQNALGRDFGIWASGFAQEEYEKARQEYADTAVEVVPADPAFEQELIELARPATEAWIEKVAADGIDGAEVLKFYQDAYDKALAELQ